MKNDDILYIFHTNKLDLQNHFLLKKIDNFYREIFKAFLKFFQEHQRSIYAISTADFFFATAYLG